MTEEEKEILIHTAERAAQHCFYGDSFAMQELVRKGYMQCLGKSGFSEDDVFTWTTKGKVWYKRLHL